MSVEDENSMDIDKGLETPPSDDDSDASSMDDINLDELTRTAAQLEKKVSIFIFLVSDRGRVQNSLSVIPTQNYILILGVQRVLIPNPSNTMR